MRLLWDVTESTRFSAVLVYDVSRWGRFQNTDAAAYYEYHCRLHEVEVIYVTELFGAEVNPITALLKSMKRAMAAEYSRDLSNKSRGGQHVAVRAATRWAPYRGWAIDAARCLSMERDARCSSRGNARSRRLTGSSGCWPLGEGASDRPATVEAEL